MVEHRRTMYCTVSAGFASSGSIQSASRQRRASGSVSVLAATSTSSSTDVSAATTADVTSGL